MEGRVIEESDDDEDIVLQGSPLYDYLKEICPDDQFKSFEGPAPIDSHPCPTHVVKQGNGLIRRLTGIPTIFKLWTSKLVSGGSFLGDPNNVFMFFNQDAVTEYYRLAINSKCMTEEDAAVLSTLLGVSRPSHRISGARVAVSILMFLLLVSSQIWVVSRLFAVAHQSDIWGATNMTDCALYSSCALMLLLGFFWQIGLLWQYLRLWREHVTRKQTFSQFVAVHASLGDLLKKAILYVQEVEVILRGYTMLTPFTPISHIERGSQAELQCPALRQAIFQVARSQFMSLRQATLTTLQEAPLRGERERGSLDDVYLAATDLGALTGEASLLTNESIGPQPTAYLKAIANLYSDQLSEFLRRHLMCLQPNMLEEDTELTSKWQEILDHTSTLAVQDKAGLENSFQLHQPLTGTPAAAANLDSRSEVREQGSKELWSPRDVLPSSARALRLHMDIIMKSTADLLARVPAWDDLREPAQQELLDLQALLSKVKGHLEACGSCVHEAEVALAKLSGQGTPAEKREQDHGETKPSDLTELTPEHLDFVAPKEPDIDFVTEEVFEADMDEDVEDDIPDYSLEDLIEEKRKRKQDSEDAKQLLVELHSVLTKREEHKEKIRRERRGGAKDGNDGLSKGETSGTGGGEMKSGLHRDELETENKVLPQGRLINERTHDASSDHRTASNSESHLVEECLPAESLTGTYDFKEGITSHQNPSGEDRLAADETSEISGMGYRESISDHQLSSASGDFASDRDDSKTGETVNNLECNHPGLGIRGSSGTNTAVKVDGFDASCLGANTSTVIKRPVPRPRKNVGQHRRPLRNSATPSSMETDPNVPHSRVESTHTETEADPHCHETSIIGGEIELDEENGLVSEDAGNVRRMEQWHHAIPMMQGLAAEAVRRSRERQALAEDTFGD